MAARVLAWTIVWLAAGCQGPAEPAVEAHGKRFVRLGVTAEPIDSSAERWPCVLDRVTGLIWEVKDPDDGLHHPDHTYSWFDPSESHQGALDYRGVPDGGECSGSECDTFGLVSAVNRASRCGFDDWRVPAKEELNSLSDPRRLHQPPTIDTDFFPDARAEDYWSANDYHFQYDAAWAWNFRDGLDRVDFKAVAKRVRLVRGQAAGPVTGEG